MLKKFFLQSLFLLFITGCASENAPGSIRFVDLQTEMRENPIGIGTAKPRFSWKIASHEHDILQNAYQIDVAASESDLESGGSRLLWTSGRVESGSSILIEYSGKPLESGKTYYWRVTVWTNNNEKARSNTQHWSAALLEESDWKAKWIGINDIENLKVEKNRTILPARYLRKEFNSASKPKRAMLYVSGLGSSVCYINGATVGNDVFGPLPTWYDASVSYLTYDVTSMIREGANAIGVALGNGRFLAMREEGMHGFGLPRLIAQLEIEYEDGERYTVISDESWSATNKGPIVENNEFDGEAYDARLELGRWNEVGYDATEWQKAALMEVPKGKLTAQLSPSLKVMEEIKPLSVKAVGGGRYIVDMGQNMVGWMQVRLNGKKDKPIKMRFAEVLNDNGTELHVANLRSALATNTYTPANDEKFEWEPTFVYHGFRYAEISGLDYEPTVDDFTGKVIYDEMATIGTFVSSDDMLNKIHKNAYWGIRGNYRGMPTDCPQRDERLGWLGDRATGAHGESFIFNNALMYKKWLVDIEESMNENGSISVVSPRYWTLYNDDVTWPSAYFYIADMLYSQFGDDAPIRAHYPSMKRWVQHQVDTNMETYILTKDTYGDWCVPPESPKLIHSEDPSRKTNGQLLSTAVFYSILKLMEQFAIINELPEDARGYKDLAARVRSTYNKRFFNPHSSFYDNNTVTANILSLQLGLAPNGLEVNIFNNVFNKIVEDHDAHISTGVVGTQHLMRGLTEHGGIELAYHIATNETYPSWGYMINNDATTIWELWNGNTADPSMNSHNHVMLLGDLLIWYYENLAGIKNAPSSVAFKNIWMEPSFPDLLNHVSASYESPYGTIESRWRRNGYNLVWNITIPANTTATIKLPSMFNVKVNTSRPGVRSVEETEDFLIVELGSGTYTLQSE